MTFYVRKSLAPGPVRFGVSPRSTIQAIDQEPLLSTGATGEFLRRRLRGFYSADTRKAGAPVVPQNPSITTTPFWSSVFDGTARGWVFLAMMVFGTLLLLAGIAVVANGTPVGWLEIILGLILLGIPIGMTVQARRQIRLREEQEEAARAEENKRHQEALASYTAALEALLNDPSETNLAAAGRERDRLDLSYKIWAPIGRSTVLHIGFAALEKYQPAGAREVNTVIAKASHAVGLNPADELRVKLDLYRVVVWHLLADDRHGAVQVALLEQLREGLDIEPGDVPDEAHAIGEFDKLRGVHHRSLPKTECAFPLGFHEYCIHTTKGSLLKRVREKVEGVPVTKLVPAEQCQVFLTNKRLIIDAKKRHELALPKIDDLEVNVDPNVLTIRPAKGIREVELQLDDSIYTAALIDIATSLDDRPKGFA
jgi:hypothetical protein